MHEYGMSVDDALDIPNVVAVDLLKHSKRRRFIDHENLAVLIQAKVGEILSGKPVKYKRPFEDEDGYSAPTTPLNDIAINKLMGLSKI